MNDALLPAVMVLGSVSPLMVNSEVLMVADDTVTLDPVAFRVAVSALLAPTVTVPKLSEVGFTVNCPGTNPEPVREIVRFGLEPSDVTAMLPVALPLVVGAKVTPKVKLCPADRVSGKVRPLMVNADDPVTVACETVTVVPPVLVSVSDCSLLVLTCTLPKALVVGLALRVPAVTPVPVSGTFKVAFEALLTIARLPLTLPPVVGANTTLKLLLCPAVRVTGKVSPFTLKPEPVAVAAVMVTLDPPVLVTVSESVLFLLTCTVPKLRLVGFALSVPAASPVPVRGMVSVGLVALLVIERFPLTSPVAVGVKMTLKVFVWPAVKVTGKLSPVILKPAGADAAVMVTLVPPELVRVSERVVLEPTVTLPKLRLVGLAVSAPGATPVPDIGIVSVGLVALLDTEMLPVAAPVVVGAKLALKLVLWPAFSVKGKLRPVMLKPVPVAVAAVMVMLVPPELVSVSESVCVLFNCTLPKLRLDGFAVSAPAASPVPVSGMLSEEFEALEVNATFPLALPPVVGAKVTVKLDVWPAFSVRGKLRPLMLKPAPVATACVTLMLAPPVLVRVAVCF